jgi:hypothetical protein
VFLEDARSIRLGLSFEHSLTWGNCGGIAMGEMSIIAMMTRDKNFSVGVGPMVHISKGGEVYEAADADMRPRASGDDVHQALSKATDHASMLREEIDSLGRAESTSRYGTKRKHLESEDESAKRQKMDQFC